MSAHLSEAELERFTLGELDEQAAVAAALHLDACPRCATRAAALEPLGAAFAALDDPPLPPTLTADILAAARAPAQVAARPELAVAAGLGALATLALILGGAPTELMARALALGRAGLTVSRALAEFMDIGAPLWAALAMVALGASAAMARTIELQRRSAA